MFPSSLPLGLTTLLVSSLLAGTASAIGDFACKGANSQSCLLWSTDTQAQGPISASAICQPDPANATMSYCGYARAACTSGADCDYGSCTGGFCAGYLGDSCATGHDADCQALFFCGTDKTCGGVGASCANGLAGSPIPNPGQQCTSGTCDTTTALCTAPPTAGVAVGSPCGNDGVCASGVCSTGDLCTAAPSARAKKAKRYILNGDTTLECPSGFTACSIGSGFSEGFECIDSSSDLEQCGGCVSSAGSGESVGQDCTTIAGVESVSCQAGTCVVESCSPGHVVGFGAASCHRE